MKNKIIKLLKIVIPVGVGLYLTWYFFSVMTNEDIEKTKSAFIDADYFWIGLSLIVAFFGHLSRAYRWNFLLEPLGYKSRLSTAYHAVMAGYIINFTVPRSGEIARAGLLTTYEKVPFEKGFATIVIERLIDLIMFGIIFFITGLIQANSEEIDAIMNSQNKDSGNLKWFLIGGLFLFGIIGLFIYLKNNRLKNLINSKLRGFWEGMQSIWTMKKKWAFLFHTVFIWLTYIAMIWFSALAFPETSGLPVAAILSAFVVGAAAVAILPGGIGVYPFWITQVLLIYNVDFMAFGIYIWVIQTALLVVLGLLSLFLIQRQSIIDSTGV